MRKITLNHLTLVATVVMLGSALAIAQQEEPKAAFQPTVEQSLTGIVTCTGRIAHRYVCQRNQTLQTCTLACVENGSAFVLTVSDRPYVLDGNNHDIEGYAGGKVTVTGVVTHDRIQVHKVSKAKHNATDTQIGEQKH